MRIAIGGIAHETNVFATTPTTLVDFRLGSPTPDFSGGPAVLGHFRGTRTIVGGFMEEATKHNWDLRALLWAFATPGGTVEQSAYEFLKGKLLEQLRAELPVDGVLLDLHGAMVTERLEDAEGDLLAAVRAAVGPQVPVIATLDLHANVTAHMIKEATMLIAFDEYPHTDMYERGLEAGRAMAGMLTKKITPEVAFEQLPQLTLPPMQCTLREPMKTVLAKAHELEQTPGVVNVSLISGFPFSNIRDTGVSVIVTANGSPEVARRTAREMAEFIWEKRDEFMPQLTPVRDAIAYAETARGLVMLADGSDNPGGGAPCDGTVILRAFIEAQVENAAVICIHDPETVERAIAAGGGGEAEFEIGGKTDNLHGAPVKTRAYVRLLSDGWYVREGAMGGGVRECFGKTAVLAIGGVEVVVTANRLQPYDTGFPRSLGIEPAKKKLIAIKSAVHFRGTYQDLAEMIFDADTPGVHRPDFAQLNLTRVRRPIFPLDPNVKFE
ncbi:MAG: M81 family metallopeptidase [Planctomycetes bacterium]|nr:M81 family metallopeptidase [Planctomycetota bacterium]